MLHLFPFRCESFSHPHLHSPRLLLPVPWTCPLRREKQRANKERKAPRWCPDCWLKSTANFESKFLAEKSSARNYQIRKFQPGKPSPLKWTRWLDPGKLDPFGVETGSTLPQWFHETVGSTGSLLVKHRGFEGLMIWLHHWQKFLWEPSWLGVVFSSAPLFSQWYSPCQIKNLPQIRTLTHHVTWLSLSLDLQLYWRQLAVAQDPKDDAI